MDINLARVVSEDLDYLFNEWNQDIDDASLRRTSPVLRSLLIEGHLAKISQACGKDLRIMAPVINRVIPEAELKEATYFQAGGAKFKGMEVQSMSFVERAFTDQERKFRYERGRKAIGKSYPVKLGVFLRQVSFAVNGVLINREEVIKYVANKLGGAHYDNNRKLSSTNEIALDDKYALLDQVHSQIVVADKNAIYYELLSIGQRMINSRDVQQLRKHLQTLVKRPQVIYA